MGDLFPFTLVPFHVFLLSRILHPPLPWPTQMANGTLNLGSGITSSRKPSLVSQDEFGSSIIPTVLCLSYLVKTDRFLVCLPLDKDLWWF